MPKTLILPHFVQYGREWMYRNKDVAC